MAVECAKKCLFGLLLRFLERMLVGLSGLIRTGCLVLIIYEHFITLAMGSFINDV